MENYELLYILPAKYTEGELKELTAKIGGIVTGLGATISDTHVLGTRHLWYQIKDQKKGVYVLVHFTAEHAMIAKMNDTLRLSTEILRHLIVTRNMKSTFLPNLTEIEEAIMKRRNQRNPEEKMAAQAVSAPISMEDIDKKLDQILTEEVK